jgi:hypothetical protein
LPNGGNHGQDNYIILLIIILLIFFTLTPTPAADKDTLLNGLAADAMSLDPHNMICV